MSDTAYISTGIDEHCNDTFLAPNGSNLVSVKDLLHNVVEMITDKLSDVRGLSSVPTSWDQIDSAQLLPPSAATEEELLASCKKLLQGSMQPASPRYFGHMDPLPGIGSVIGSMITAAVNNNMLSREMAPIFSDLEQRLLSELAGLFGLPHSTAGGVMQSGGSLCNLQALAVARNAKLNAHTSGLAGCQQKPVIFASELCHSSIQKAAMILGLGTDGVIPVPTDSRYKMCPEALKNAIALAKEKNQKPIAVVATAGTTVTGSIDPLPEIASLCKQNDLWLHVDASYGGAIVFHPEKRALLQGIDQADSITFNPQKWCYVTKACALVLFRDVKVLDDYFRIEAPYMNLHENTGARNLGEWGIQGTRAPEVAKWWLTLVQFGTEGLSQLIETGFKNKDLFLEHVRQYDYLKTATDPELNILCFRDHRTENRNETLAERNRALQDCLLQKQNAFFSLPILKGSRWLKAVFLNPFTSQEDFQEIFEEIESFTG